MERRLAVHEVAVLLWCAGVGVLWSMFATALSVDRLAPPLASPGGVAWRLLLWPAFLVWPLGGRLYGWGVNVGPLTIATVVGAACGTLTGFVVVFWLRRAGV